MVGSAWIARFSCGTYSPSPLRVSHWSLVNSQMSTPNSFSRSRLRSRGGGRDQMLFDRIQLRIDDRAAVEGADRKRDLQRLDQKSHADGRPAGGDGEADAGCMQPPHRGLGAFGQGLVLGQQGAVDIGDDEGDAGHERFLRDRSLAAGLSFSWRTMSSTMASTEASIDTVTGFSSPVRRLQGLELAGPAARRHEMTFPRGEPVGDQFLRALEIDDADIAAAMHEHVAIGALAAPSRRSRRARRPCRRGRSRRRSPAARASGLRR